VGSTKISLGTIQMSTEHNVERLVTVPGVVSCTEDAECPTGQTCQDDLRCK
jgi:Cys-rich repeat protein